jgi:hypothetical protein
MKRLDSYSARRDRPVEHRDVQVVAGRVVQIRTQHIGDSFWLATGWISEALPTGPRLRPPIELSATGQTELECVEELKRLIAERRNGSAKPAPR